MDGTHSHQTRRGAIAVAIAVAAGAAASAATQLPAAAKTKGLALAASDKLHDWDWLVGSWNVQHRKLTGRLVGSNDWMNFTGTCINWPTMGGRGNVDDNVLDLPDGAYYGQSIRALDSKTREWLIWWIDSRNAGQLDPPVRGQFKDGIGIFLADDSLDGHPIKVRFQWSSITPTSARWEQAFSGDGGDTWEVNWIMQFTRRP